MASSERINPLYAWKLLQTVNNQMKCSIKLHFIRVCTVCLDYLKALFKDIDLFRKRCTGTYCINMYRRIHQNTKS